jgi:hypothetical protein
VLVEAFSRAVFRDFRRKGGARLVLLAKGLQFFAKHANYNCIRATDLLKPAYP